MKADNNINLYTFTVEVPASKTVQSYFPLSRGIYFKSVKNASGLSVPIRAHFSRDDNTQGQLCTVIEGYSIFNPDNSFNCVVFLNEQSTAVTVTCSVSNGQIQYMAAASDNELLVLGGNFTSGVTPLLTLAPKTRLLVGLVNTVAVYTDVANIPAGVCVAVITYGVTGSTWAITEIVSGESYRFTSVVGVGAPGNRLGKEFELGFVTPATGTWRIQYKGNESGLLIVTR